MGNSLIPVSLLLDATTVSATNLESPWIWVKVFVFLLLLGLGAFFLNYFSRKKNLRSPMSGKSKLSVVDTCSLGNRQFLVVAQYESDKHLLAVSSSGISHLADLSKNCNSSNQPITSDSSASATD